MKRMKKIYFLFTMALILSVGQVRGQDLGTGNFGMTIDDLSYTGTDFTKAQIEALLVVKDIDTDTELTLTTDYTIKEVTQTAVDAGSEVTVSIGGEGTYSGEKSEKFTITAKKLEEGDVTITADPKEYTGSDITLEESDVEVKYGEKELEYGTDFTIGNYGNNTSVTDAATADIEFTGNYSGTIPFTFAIDPKDISDAEMTVAFTSPYIYDGEGQTIEKGNITSLEITGNNSIVLGDNDYSILADGYKDNINAGNAAVFTIKGEGNFEGQKELNFEIEAKEIAGAEITVNFEESPVYTGSAFTPALATIAVKVGEKTLTAEDDYSFADTPYADNINAGTAKVNIKGEGNYKGTEQGTFTIGKKALEDSMIQPITPQLYEGSPVVLSEEDLKVIYNEKTLKLNTDYTADYTENNAVGPATVKIKAKTDGNFEGEASAKFDIVNNDINSEKIEITFDEIGEKVFTGEAIKIENLAVRDTTDIENPVDLTEGEDFEVIYLPGNINVADIITVTIAGIGDWGGTREIASFEIKKASTADIEIDPIEDHPHTGSPVEPGVVAKLNGIVIDDDEYELTYEQNVEPGTAKVILDFSGSENIEGENIEKTFVITQDKIDFIMGITVAPGIIANYQSGNHTVKPGSDFEFIFSLEDPNLKAENILFEVDRQSVTPTKVEGSNQYSYSFKNMDGNHSITVALAEYSIEIPEIEGVDIDPDPGKHPIEYNKPFTFTVTLEDDYDESDIKVYVNGELLEPVPVKSASYTYTIPLVTGPITIEIKGVEPNASGNASIESGIKVYSEDGVLFVETPEPYKVSVYSVSGRLHVLKTVNGLESMTLPGGIYIVKVDNETYKVLIK